MQDIIEEIERDLDEEYGTRSLEGIDKRLDDDSLTAQEAGFLQGYHEHFEE